MTQQDKKFARAYVAQNSGHDFTELRELCEEIVFISSGYDGEEALLPTVVAGLQDFSPRRDVIVPVGNVFINLLVGMVASYLSTEWGYYRVALYRDKAYHVQIVSVNTVGELINAHKATSTRS
jgi:hypothetical protein